MFFSFVPPFHFNFYRNLKDITRSPFGLTEKLVGDCYYTGIFGNIVSVIQNPESGELSVTVSNTNGADKESIYKELQHRFGLNQDMNSFYQFAGQDPKLKSVIQRLKGLTMFQKSSYFEMLVTAITDQQLNVAFATTLKRRLIITYGEKQKNDNMELWIFPTPERLAQLPEDALFKLQFSRAKSRYIIRLARGILDGKIPIDNWGDLGDIDLLLSLTSIYGIGKWTAEYSAMIGFNRPDIVPGGDIGLMRAVQRCYKMDHRPSESEVRQIAESWSPWRSLVTYYLWHGYE